MSRVIETSTIYRETADTLISDVQKITRPLHTPRDLDPLIDWIGDSRYVLLGEASHGTSDYYTWRARISQRLIQDKGFSFIAVEGDWPDCYNVNRYIKHYPDSGDAAYDVLHRFDRWPTWMWANWEITALTEWLKDYNEDIPDDKMIGFYGLDVYSLWDSMREIIEYLQQVDPQAVEVAKRALRCFEPYGEDVQQYAWATTFVPDTCEDEVIRLLRELRTKVYRYKEDREEAFDAEQNALIAVNAERYYRAMIRGGPASWNIRDTHMVETLERLMQFHGSSAKAIVWEHNTHIGDARATDMVDEGEVNVGQLVREKHSGDGVVLVGFGSHRGSVIAGHEWGAPMQVMPVPEAERGSWEDVLHRASPEDKLLLMSDAQRIDELNTYQGHRAIGVVYRPEFERFGNYVPSIIPKRYDSFLYIDETKALHPLHIKPTKGKEPPETYPWGI